jgi:hypothetical protein
MINKPTSSGSRHRPLLLICLLLFSAAFALRLVLTLRFVDVSDPKLWEFGVIARNVYRTGIYSFHAPEISTAYMPPGYPLLIACCYQIFGIGRTAYVSLAVLLLIFEMAIPVLVGWIAWSVWDRRVALTAGLLSLFWPLFLIMSGRLHPVPIYTALLIGAYGVLFSRRLLFLWRAALAGVLLGVYANFRYEAILFLLPAIYCLVREHATPPRTAVRRLSGAMILLLSFILLIGPWLIRNQRIFGTVVMSTSGGFNLLRGHHDGATGTGRDLWPAARDDPDAATEIPVLREWGPQVYDHPGAERSIDRRYARMAVNYIAGHPRRELELLGRKMYYFLVADFTHPVMRRWPVWLPSLAALIAGLWFFLRSGRGEVRQQVLWLVFAAQLLLSMIVFVLPRYRMVVDFIPVLFFSAWLSRSVAPHVRKMTAAPTP